MTQSHSSSKKRKRSGFAPPSKYAHIDNQLTDSIAPNPIVLFVGLNPGIRTATSGHAYSHPSNLFWKLLHSSGCTPRLCSPTEDGDMPRLYNLGLTNIVSRPTKDGSELSKQEMDESVAELEAKIARFRPETVGIVGKSIWESIWRVKHRRAIRKGEFRYGYQDESERMGKVKNGENSFGGARVYVLTTTSGLAASMKIDEKRAIWRGLGEWVEERRGERAEVKAEVKVEVKAEVEVEVKAEVKDEVEAEVKNEVEAEVKNEVEAEVKDGVKDGVKDEDVKNEQEEKLELEGSGEAGELSFLPKM